MIFEDVCIKVCDIWLCVCVYILRCVVCDILWCVLRCVYGLWYFALFVCLCILRCVNVMSYDWLLLSSVQHIHVANFILQIFGKSVSKFDTFLNLIRQCKIWIVFFGMFSFWTLGINTTKALSFRHFNAHNSRNGLLV